MIPESAMQVQVTNKKWERNNSPSPASYKSDEAMEKSAKFNKANVIHKIGKA